MKKALFITLLCCCCIKGFSDSYYFAWDGIGLSTKYNYNAGQSWGTYQYKGIANGLGTGFMEINQQFNLNYVNNGTTSPFGSNIRYNANYYFLAPMVVFQLNKSGSLQCYVDGGAGYSQSGTATLNKWQHVSWSQGGVYDSSIDETTNISTFAFRAGFGFTQFYALGGNFHLFLNEDFGFLLSPLMQTDYNTQTLSGTQQFFQPSYFSLRIGIAFITHSKDAESPYRIYL